MSSLHIAVTGPMDVRRLVDELQMSSRSKRSVPAGRGGHSVTELALALASKTEQLDLITLDTGLDEPVAYAGSGVRLAIGTFRPEARARSLDLFRVERTFIEDTLRCWKPQVASAHWTYEYALGALDSQIPTLITVRDWSPAILRHSRDAYRTVRLGMQFLTFARGKHFAAVSPYMAKRVERVVRSDVRLLPNALGAEWFEPRNVRPRTPRILAINNGFGRRKNVHALLRAWPTVRRMYPAAELVLVGSGYEASGPAWSWAAKRDLVEGVRFRGPLERHKLPEELGLATVFAHPALEESFGMVVLEAMATGVPVLGGKASGAVPWILRDGAGITVDVRRPSAIAAGLLLLLDSPSLARSTAEKGLNRARNHFSVEAVAGAYMDSLAAIREQDA
jgi:L-malate glycosyltransferase